MSKYITVAFEDTEGNPAEGLSPVVSIWRVSDNSLLVDDVSMLEIGGGWYKYLWTGYDPDIPVVIRCNGGVSLNNRYGWGVSLVDVEAKVDLLQVDLSFIKNIEGGKWQIVGEQMIFYKEDNITEIARFDLFNEAGLPANQNVFKRMRV